MAKKIRKKQGQWPADSILIFLVFLKKKTKHHISENLFQQ